MSTIDIIDSNSATIIKSFPLDKEEEAHKFASQMEEYGINIRISSPSLPETLARSLGRDDSEIDLLKRELEEEITSHHDECCSHNESK